MRTHVHPVLVGFGDCDPAGIVYYPNFFRWFDAATHAMFNAVGQSYDRAREENGWIVWPLVDAGSRFRAPARYNERIEIRSTIERWSARSFRLAHEAWRGDTLLAAGWEVRFIGETHPGDPRRLRTVPIPAWLPGLFGDAAPPHSPGAHDGAPAPSLRLLDTITAIDASCRDGIVVSGSHGGPSSAGFVLRAPVRPRAVFLNDAGVGKDGAGIAALALLEEIGVSCACYGHDSARIGVARDGYENGVVTHLNARCRATGIRPRMPVREAVTLLGAG